MSEWDSLARDVSWACILEIRFVAETRVVSQARMPSGSPSTPTVNSDPTSQMYHASCGFDTARAFSLAGKCTYLRLAIAQEQVRVMTEKHHVYLTQDGRISMAGLSASKCRYLAEAINDAVRNA